MNANLRYLRLIFSALLISLSYCALATNPASVVPVLDLLLGSDNASNTPPFPRRRDFAGTAVFSPVTENLISRTVGDSQITYSYDALNRLSGFATTTSNDPTSNISAEFIYVSLATERLSKIVLTSYSSFGTELAANINFEYTSTNQISGLTNASFQGSIGSDANDEQIFTVSVNYEPTYENGLLTTIAKQLTNDLPPPLGGPGASTITIAYQNDTLVEIIDTDQGGGQSIGRRTNTSALEQRVTRQLLDGDGGVFFSTTEIAQYEAKECNASNRLLEENVLLLNLFFVPNLNVFLEPELCRD